VDKPVSVRLLFLFSYRVKLDVFLIPPQRKVSETPPFFVVTAGAHAPSVFAVFSEFTHVDPAESGHATQDKCLTICEQDQLVRGWGFGDERNPGLIYLPVGEKSQANALSLQDYSNRKVLKLSCLYARI